MLKSLSLWPFGLVKVEHRNEQYLDKSKRPQYPALHLKGTFLKSFDNQVKSGQIDFILAPILGKAW
jgi:hypothetical protein